MKKIWIAVLLGLALAFITYGLVWAGPYLTCDSYTVANSQVQPDGFQLSIDDGSFLSSPAFVYGNGEIAAMIDLYATDLTLTHTFSLKACYKTMCSSATVYNYSPGTLYPRPPGVIKILITKPLL